MKTQKTYPIVRDSPHSRRMTVEFFPWMVEERRGKNAAAYYLTHAEEHPANRTRANGLSISKTYTGASP
jgi:hypothetical protein